MVEKNKEYVQAARVIGVTPLGIMRRHLLPNVLGPVLVLATINIATAIITEATLSFLGVGVPPTQPSLGTLIRVGNDFLFSGEWWITIFPGVGAGDHGAVDQPARRLAARRAEPEAALGVRTSARALMSMRRGLQGATPMRHAATLVAAAGGLAPGRLPDLGADVERGQRVSATTATELNRSADDHRARRRPDAARSAAAATASQDRAGHRTCSRCRACRCGRAGRATLQRVRRSTSKPCKRYYINAQFDGPLSPSDWKPVIDHVEPIAGCARRRGEVTR